MKWGTKLVGGIYAGGDTGTMQGCTAVSLCQSTLSTHCDFIRNFLPREYCFFDEVGILDIRCCSVLISRQSCVGEICEVSSSWNCSTASFPDRSHPSTNPLAHPHTLPPTDSPIHLTAPPPTRPSTSPSTCPLHHPLAHPPTQCTHHIELCLCRLQFLDVLPVVGERQGGERGGVALADAIGDGDDQQHGPTKHSAKGLRGSGKVVRDGGREGGKKMKRGVQATRQRAALRVKVQVK